MDIKEMIFNEFDFSKILKVESIKRNLMPAINNFHNSLTSKDGLLYMSDNFSARKIEVTCRVFAKSKEELEEKRILIAEKLYSDTPKFLRLRGIKHAYLAKVDGEVEFNPFKLRRAEIVIHFICYDPFGYGDEIRIKKILSEEVRFDYRGNIPTKPFVKVMIKQQTNNLTIRLKESEENIVISHPLNAYDVVTIDFENEVVFVNNSITMTAISYDSIFFNIKKGLNTLTVNPHSDFEVQFFERWL